MASLHRELPSVSQEMVFNLDINWKLLFVCCLPNDLAIGWQNGNHLSHPNATLAPQARQARASGENLNYVTLAPQARQASGEILNFLLHH